LKKSKIDHEENSIKSITESNLNNYYCKEHQNNILEFLCMECELLICKICLIKDLNRHNNNHTIIEIKNSNYNKIIELNKKICSTKFEKVFSDFKKKFSTFDDYERQLLETRSVYENKIKEVNKSIMENKNKKNEELFNYQKILNVKSIVEEKPIQFLLNYNKYIGENNKKLIINKEN
jgi:hypothetical protein